MGHLMDEDPQEETERDNRAKDIGSVSGNNQRFVDGDIEELLDQFRGQKDLAADNPGEEGYNEEERPVEEDGNPVDGPDPERPVHRREYF